MWPDRVSNLGPLVLVCVCGGGGKLCKQIVHTARHVMQTSSENHMQQNDIQLYMVRRKLLGKERNSSP